MFRPRRLREVTSAWLEGPEHSEEATTVIVASEAVTSHEGRDTSQYAEETRALHHPMNSLIREDAPMPTLPTVERRTIDPAGPLAERLAYDAFTQLITGSDAYVDAHCGDMVEALQPFALYEAGPAEDQARELAAAYALPYVIRQAAGPGRVQGDGVHAAGLDGVLAQLDMAPVGQPVGQPAEPRSRPTYLRRFILLRCIRGGWWAPVVKAGDPVTAGQVIGTVSSLDGGCVQET